MINSKSYNRIMAKIMNSYYETRPQQSWSFIPKEILSDGDVLRALCPLKHYGHRAGDLCKPQHHAEELVIRDLSTGVALHSQNCSVLQDPKLLPPLCPVQI